MYTSCTSPAQVTISLLPVSLSLVHIPRTRLTQLSHPVIRQILEPNPTFLNVTCNEIELSLFADHRLLEDFEPIARRDRQRQRAQSNSSSSRKGSTSDAVEISYERWNVLQIDSHTDQIENSGARVTELSAPLAAAGISILYQSSYTSDFIFVKSTRLQEVMSLLALAGFDLYSSEQDVLSISSNPSTPPLDDRSFVDISSTGAVLTRSRSSTDTSSSRSSESQSSRPDSDNTSMWSRNKSQSPTSGEVTALSSDLACIGLSDDSIDVWGLKIIKLIAFPDLIDSPSVNTSRSPLTHHSPDYPLLGMLDKVRSSSFSSSSSDEDGYFSHSPRGNQSTSSLTTSASRSYSDLTNLRISTSSLQSASKHVVSPSTSTSPVSHQISNVLPFSHHNSRIPFFSFTRTSEGSSLTTDVSVLATLFPPHERHMVICSGELDMVDDYLDNDCLECDDVQRGTLRCLQIDLRRFGLDKHGLVHQFSKVLEENKINHMYSSTFKTANILVDKRHAFRAQALLRAC